MTEPIVEPIVVADDLGARTRQGRVFAKLDCAIPPGAVTAVVGPAGSGRSSLLLTIAGRMTPSSGTLLVCGEQLPEQRARVREQVAVARIGGAVDLDPDLRVRDGFAERVAGTEGDFAKLMDILGADLDPYSLAGDLSAFDRALAALALALLDHPWIVILDDVDDGLSGVDQRELWSRLRGITRTGTTVVASTVDREPAEGIADVMVNLGRTH